MNMEIYLDNAATTRVCPEAAQAALAAMTECYGNPSSTHKLGREAKRLLDSSRRDIASALGAKPGELVFTSCGSESDVWALLGGAQAARHTGRHIISSLTEHDAVRRTLDELERRGWEISRLAPGADGAVPVAAVAEALRPDTALVSLMLVNNETGAVTDIAAVSKLIRERGYNTLLHTDAVQGFLKLPFTARTLGADMISISGHKIHAPKGVGALYIREGLHLPPYIFGGSQENGRRAGTEAMPQISAFAEATRLGRKAMPDALPRMNKLREGIIERLRRDAPELVIIGGGAPHILSLSLPGWRSEVLMNYLESKGVYVSRSSACKRGARSHVLEAMKLPAPVIDGAIRLGLSRYTTEQETEAFCQALIEAKNSLAHR